MFYSFRLITPPLEKQTPFKVHDGERTMTYFAGRNATEHYYCNLLLDSKPTIDFPGEYEVEELSSSNEPYFTPVQIQLNKSLSTDEGLNYRVEVRGTPRRAIISGPQYAGDSGPAAPYAMLRAERFDLDDTLYISFQDPFFSHGSYLLSDNYGKNPLPKAVSIIKESLKKHGLTSEQATFVGASKGANIAAMLSQHFSDNQLIVCAYAMDLEYWIRNTGMAHIGMTLDSLNVDIPDSLSLLQKEADTKETHWFYSQNDPKSNRGLEETFTAKKLKKYSCPEAHGAILLERWEEIKKLILERHP